MTRFSAKFYVTGHYRSAVKLALELSETFTHAPEAFVLGHRLCIDASMRTLSPIEVLSNDSWTIRTPTFSNKFVIIDGCILHSTAEGHIEPKHSNHRKIEQLLAFMGGIKWDEEGVDTPIEIAEERSLLNSFPVNCWLLVGPPGRTTDIP